MTNQDNFIQAIHNKQVIRLSFNSQEKGVITRKCIPFDYGPSRRSSDKSDKYHCYDLDSPEGSHTLSIFPKQIVSIEILDQRFEPSSYVTWTPNWFVTRDWGQFS